MFKFSERETPSWAGDPQLSFELRASHLSELSYLFGLKLPLFEKLTEKQERLSKRMTDTWVDFAESGKMDWPSFRSGGYVQSLASGPWKRTEFTKDHNHAFWKNIR